ncbi:MAG: helix-turn-helix transcriptional regulator [Treponema sp.]|uniref:helix-turn-helix domain-containing protein n=1 Tax=Treponema sp. TaxID=166 RepID=UPI001B5EC663|nr:helix-turn-helix transcriptional regulator [Treponema sp.]MBP3771530.1 helix-turn-helix transcriptional regulator [Treponema sp.]MBQ9282111.1 helix-turn-helix transcriptional regulator [Treponema sp.]
MIEFQANFIQNMKFYRKRARLSQAQLAELCNVSNGTIGNIECGITKPSFDLIYQIAKALSVPASDLFKTSIREDKLSASQVEIVSETVHSAINEALSKALVNLRFKNSTGEISPAK